LEITTPTREDRLALHIKGIKMVLVASVLGAAAGIISYSLPAGAKNFSVLVLAILIYVQKYVFPPMGIKSAEFGFKDWFFLGFISFSYWFVTWTLMLNTA
jgi:hypothetical protein